MSGKHGGNRRGSGLGSVALIFLFWLPMASADGPIENRIVRFHVSEEPLDLVVYEGTPPSFSVVASATDWAGTTLSVSYQWQTNGVDIAGKTASSMTLGSAQPHDDGLVVRCRVSAQDGAFWTREARLTVLYGETWASHLVGDPSLNKAHLYFYEAVDSQTSTDLANYTAVGITLLDATKVSHNHITFTTSPQTPGQQYEISHSGIHDNAFNPSEFLPEQLKFTAWTKESGWARRVGFNLPEGSTIQDLADTPDDSGISTFISGLDFEANSNQASASGQRLNGWLRPPTTGNYDFYIAASGPAVFSLSNGSSAEGLQPIVSEPEGQALRDYSSPEGRVNSPQNSFFPGVVDVPVNQSPNTVGSVTLEAGIEYYFELQHVDGNADQFASVVMVPAGSAVPSVGTPGISGDSLATFTNPDAFVTLDSRPEFAMPLFVHSNIGEDVRLEVNVMSSPTPIVFQWQRDGVDLPGETLPSIDIAASEANPGACYLCRVSVPGKTVYAGPVLLAVDRPVFRLREAGDAPVIEIPPVQSATSLKQIHQLESGGVWAQVGTAVPGAHTTLFVVPNSDQHQFYTVDPAIDP